MVGKKITSIGKIGVPVQDLSRAIDFYQNKLGLSLLFKTDSMAFFEINEMRLLLSIPEKEDYLNASSVIYFNVMNIQAVYLQLRDEIDFIDEPHLVAKMGQTETWMVFFKDSENNTHAFMSEMSSE